MEPLTKLNEVMERGMKIITWDSLVLDEYIDLCKQVIAAVFVIKWIKRMRNVQVIPVIRRFTPSSSRFVTISAIRRLVSVCRR